MLFAVLSSGRFKGLESLHQIDSFPSARGLVPIPIAAAMSGIGASGVARGRSAPEIPRTGSAGSRGCPAKLRSGPDSGYLQPSPARPVLDLRDAGLLHIGPGRQILHLRDHRSAFFGTQSGLGKKLNSLLEVRLRLGAPSHHVKHLGSGSRRIGPDGRGVNLRGKIAGWIRPALRPEQDPSSRFRESSGKGLRQEPGVGTTARTRDVRPLLGGIPNLREPG